MGGKKISVAWSKKGVFLAHAKSTAGVGNPRGRSPTRWLRLMPPFGLKLPQS